MRDHRLDKWASVLVNYSLSANASQAAFLLGDVEALPLIEAVYEKFILEGVRVEYFLLQRSLSEFFLKYGQDNQLAYTPPARMAGIEKVDLYLYVGANSNSKMLSQIEPKRQNLAATGYKPILDLILGRSAEEKLRWCTTVFPTSSAAQDAEMGNIEYENFIFNAGFLNEDSPVFLWQTLKKNKRIY